MLLDSREVKLEMHCGHYSWFMWNGRLILCESGVRRFYDFPEGTDTLEVLVFDRPAANRVMVKDDGGFWVAGKKEWLSTSMSYWLARICGGRETLYIELRY